MYYDRCDLKENIIANVNMHKFELKGKDTT